MQKALSSFIKLSFCALLALGASYQIQAADVAGTWTWTTPGRNGGDPQKSTLKLKVDGDKVTGTLTAPGRGGNSTDIQIEDGKIKGDEVSFKITREFQNNKRVSKYSGKLSGDTIKGQREFDRNGETQKQDWEAKRDK